MALTQENREIAVYTPLGDDVLLLQSMSGHEQLGRPFQYQLQLLSTKHEIDFKDIVGQNVTVRLNLPTKKKSRFFNGYISRFVQTGFVLSNRKERLAKYSATMVPWLWFLTRTADCHIYQDMTVPDIIKDLLKTKGYSDVEDKLGEQYRKWEYCVQYRETDFNFLSRLMEQEGIYYYFKHDSGKHTLVLADPKTALEPVADYDEIPFSAFDSAGERTESLWDWTVEQVIQPGLYSHTDFDFEKPASSLLAKSKIEREHAMAGFEVYDYPGEYSVVKDGEYYARARIEELQSQHEICFGTSDARGVAVGYTFKVPNHPRADQNREYHVLSAKYKLETDSYESSGQAGQVPTYMCDFSVIESSRPFRAPRVTPKPVVQGPQTAIVAGKQGEEIWIDKYGRIKVQFHWDRYSKADETSSCWVRVAQSWAGKNWGSIFIPRVGQEVIVEFLEGDPDRPIVTGSVYNARSMPPYDLPANATMSTIKSNSSKGGQGFNEIRFEDKKGKEQIFVHGEKNLDVRVKNDTYESIGNERHLVVKKDQLEKVEGDKHSMVTGDRLSKTDGDQGDTIAGSRMAKIDGGDHLTVAGDHNVKASGDVNLDGAKNINQKAGMKVSVTAGTDLHEKAGTSYAVEGGTTVHIKGGMTVVVEGGMQLSLKVGGNFIDINPAGVFIQGTMVMINSGGAAGAGSGSSPTSPAAPEAPDAPKEAKEAADDKAGQTDEPPQPSSYSASAQVMQTAGKDGTPFCEKCEAAKKKMAQGGGP